MRSAQLDLQRYDTDKIKHGFLPIYDQLFADLVDEPVALLELGVYKGGSLQLWQDYFPRGTIVGIDLQLPSDFVPRPGMFLFQGNQTDTAFLSRVAQSTAPQGFDIIIDDASHVGAYTKKSFWHLFDHHLKPRGFYVIEDWVTGYWEDWLDGKNLDFDLYQKGDPPENLPFTRDEPRWKEPWPNHSHGMVAFVKQLIDELGASFVLQKTLKGTPGRPSKFERMVLYPGLVCVQKSRWFARSGAAE